MTIFRSGNCARSFSAEIARVDDGGRRHDGDADDVHVSFFDQFDQLTGDQFGRGILRLEALLLQQLGEHGPGEFVAIRSRRQAINAASRRAGAVAATARHRFVRSRLGSDRRARAEVFDDVAHALLDVNRAAPGPAAPRGDRSPRQ